MTINVCAIKKGRLVGKIQNRDTPNETDEILQYLNVGMGRESTYLIYYAKLQEFIKVRR